MLLHNSSTFDCPTNWLWDNLRIFWQREEQLQPIFQFVKQQSSPRPSHCHSHVWLLGKHCFVWGFFLKCCQFYVLIMEQNAYLPNGSVSVSPWHRILPQRSLSYWWNMNSDLRCFVTLWLSCRFWRNFSRLSSAEKVQRSLFIIILNRDMICFLFVFFSSFDLLRTVRQVIVLILLFWHQSVQSAIS